MLPANLSTVNSKAQYPRTSSVAKQQMKTLTRNCRQSKKSAARGQRGVSPTRRTAVWLCVLNDFSIQRSACLANNFETQNYIFFTATHTHTRRGLQCAACNWSGKFSGSSNADGGIGSCRCVSQMHRAAFSYLNTLATNKATTKSG